MTFPTSKCPNTSHTAPQLSFNAREGLVTFPTAIFGLGLSTARSARTSFNAREGLVTFPTAEGEAFEHLMAARFNAREGLVTFPTARQKRRRAARKFKSFNAREGLVTFPTRQ